MLLPLACRRTLRWVNSLHSGRVVAEAAKTVPHVTA